MAKVKKGASAEREKIRRDLLDQLERNGTVGEHYADLVDYYMRLYDVKNELLTDIASRGAKVEVVTASGSRNIKTNDSVGDLLRVSMQMLKIADSLGLDPAQTDGGDGDDDRL